MQATWPASLTLYENFTYFAERVGKLSAGTLKDQEEEEPNSKK